MPYKKIKLGDISKVSSSKRIFAKQYVDFGIPFYRQKEIIDKKNKVEISAPLFISQETYDEIKKRFGVPQKGDLLITAVGVTLGIPYVVDDEIFYFKDGNLIWLREFDNEIDSNYIYYWILSDVGQKSMWARTIGSAQPALTIDTIKQFEIPVPSYNAQVKIVSILKAYDDLIENNQKQIKLLEEAAQRLYKEWFVDLRFPGYEDVAVVDGVPEGWYWCRLEDAVIFDPKITLDKNRTKQSIPMAALSTTSMVLDPNEFAETESNSGSKFQNGDTLLARITPCLENGKTAFVWGIDSDEGAIGSTEFIVMRSRTLNPYIVYLLARTDSFRQIAINSMSGSDGRQRVKSDKLKMINYVTSVK